MIPELRRAYNKSFSEARHQDYVRQLEAAVGRPIDFRLAETPVFLPPVLRLLFTVLKEKKGGHRITLAPGDLSMSDLLVRHGAGEAPATLWQARRSWLGATPNSRAHASIEGCSR